MGNAALAVQLLLGLVDRMASISAVISKAKAEGRDITDAELDALAAADDKAKAELDAAIAEAKSK